MPCSCDGNQYYLPYGKAFAANEVTNINLKNKYGTLFKSLSSHFPQRKGDICNFYILQNSVRKIKITVLL